MLFLTTGIDAQLRGRDNRGLNYRQKLGLENRSGVDSVLLFIFLKVEPQNDRYHASPQKVLALVMTFL